MVNEQRRLKNEAKWLEKARRMHANDNYDYSLVEYIDTVTPVKIICPIHGVFEQMPMVHTGKKCSGCPQCGRIRIAKSGLAYTIADIDAIVKKNFNVLYELVPGQEYTRCNHKLKLHCTKHNIEFCRVLQQIVNGKAICPECRKERVHTYTHDEIKAKLSALDTKNTLEFIDEYNAGTRGKYLFRCKEHGEFYSRYTRIYESLKHGNNGCPKCAYNKYSTCNRINPNIILTRMNVIHLGKYSYDMNNYIDTHHKIPIHCPKHGMFMMTPELHLKGSGCPVCSSSKLERLVLSYMIEHHNIKYEYQYKPKWLCNQSLDFFLPEFNVAIECQGLQHFQPIAHFGGEPTFEKTKVWDQRKQRLCANHGIKLFYYSKCEGHTVFLNEPLYQDLDTMFDVIREYAQLNRQKDNGD